MNEEEISLKEFLIEKFNTLECNLTKEITRTDGKLTLMEEKNCRKHQEILATVNQFNGKLDERIEKMDTSKLDKEYFDKFMESNNGKLKMIDDRITKNDGKINYVMYVLTTVFAVITMFGRDIIAFVLSIYKKI